MKKAFIAIVVFTGLLTASGCKKFIEQEPYNRISVSDIFKDFEGARTTLVGAYDELSNVDYYQRAFGLYAELTGGNIKYSRSANQAFLNTFFLNNNAIAAQNDLTAFYQIAYNTIYRANALLENINNVADANALQKNRMVADAYTLRAMAHFDLVRVFAQPYIFTPNASHPGIVIRIRNTSADEPAGDIASVGNVYAQIIADFDSAIIRYSNSVGIYAGGDERSWLSGDAAKALLARVLLYQQNWTRVTALCNEVLAGNYPLVSSTAYAQSWRRKGARQMDNEAIFYLFARTDVNQGSFGDNFNNANETFGYMAANNDLLKIFEPGDVRDSASMFQRVSISGSNYYFTRKYQGRNDSADNQKIIRASELWLMRAEAQAQNNNFSAALSDLNRIRLRGNPTAAPLNINDKQQLLDAIFVERRRELCFEGHLFFDIVRQQRNLVRNDCLGTTCSINYPSPLFAVPIPGRR